MVQRTLIREELRELPSVAFYHVRWKPVGKYLLIQKEQICRQGASKMTL